MRQATYILTSCALLGWMAAAAQAAADLGLTKTAEPYPVRVGGDLTFRITVTNRGPHTATNVVISDPLPPGLTFASCQASQGTWTNESGTLFAYLGNIAAGATAAVVAVVNPTQEGILTNEVGASADNAAGIRASAVVMIIAANRSPEITMPATVLAPIGMATGFSVSVTDPDHDPLVTITNTLKPAGASFDGTNLTWTASRAFWNTTNWCEFVADDHQGEANSVVTQRTALIVPYDGDADDMDDGWEWDTFGTLTRSGGMDWDGDGLTDYEEYVAGTEATNAESVFTVSDVVTPAGTSNHLVRVPTRNGRKYAIYWRDSLTSGSWQPFASTNAGVWWETSPVPTNRIFVDDEGTNTTGSGPAGGRRFYRVRITRY